MYGDTGWKPAGSGNDVPLEAKDPTVDCKFKTHNGAALFVREKPGEEGLLLVDRAGQYVEMSSPTSAEEVGSLKRGETKAPSSEFEGLLVAEAFVKAMDLSGNKVYLPRGLTELLQPWWRTRATATLSSLTKTGSASTYSGECPTAD